MKKNRMKINKIFQDVVLSCLVFLSFNAQANDPRDTSIRYAKQVDRWHYEYLPLRAELHKKIVETRMRSGVVNEHPRLIFTAGPFGAGKSFVTSALEKLSILDVSQFLWIDPDSIKEEIPEYAELKKSAPEDAATLVHKESGHIQEKLFEAALRSKKNIIVDGSLRAKDWWTSEFNRIKQSYPEYSISIVSVSAPEEVLLQRVEARGRVTGRLIPSELVLETSRAVRESVNHLSTFTDSTIEIDNGITPTIKSVRIKGRSMPTHFDLSGQLGPGAVNKADIKVSSYTELLAATSKFQRTIILGGYGQLGYEDFSLLKSYVDRISSTYGANTLFVLSHQTGVGRAKSWLSEQTGRTGGHDSVLVGDEKSILSLLSTEQVKSKIEVVSLRGEYQETTIIKTASVQKVPVLLVRDPSLEPETEAVALQLTKNPRFESDPTKVFETAGSRQSSFRLVRSLEVPKVQRKYEERTRELRTLYRTIERVSDQELIRVVLKTYPELVLLTEGTIATPEAQAANAQSVQRVQLSNELSWLNPNNESTYPRQNGEVPSTIGNSIAASIFGKPYAEFDRTIAALLIFKRLLTGDYEGFVQGQPENVRLSRESFLEISMLVRRVAYNTSTRDALFSFLVFNNVGKSEAVVKYLKSASGLHETNHQRTMSQVLSLYAFVSPTYQRLDEFQRQAVLSSFEREFNLAQLAQGEAPAAYLAEHAARTKEQREFYLATSLLKVAAARGHDSVLGSLVMTQPVYNGIKTAIDGVEQMTNTKQSVAQTYEEFLRQRAKVILPADLQTKTWIARVGLMFRCSNQADGKDLTTAIADLPAHDQKVLEREFSATGFKGDPALLLYYGPAMLDNLRKSVNRPYFFRLGVHLLAQVLKAARQEANSLRVQEVLQVRMDSIAKQIRDANGLPGIFDIEVYHDSNYGVSAKLKTENPTTGVARTIPAQTTKSCGELLK
jgi:hypothetical protein